MEQKESLYSILGIQSDATENEIKKSYRKLAFKYHPDRNPDEESTEKFKKIAHSYSILSDPEKRKNYDQFGDSFLNNSTNFEDISPFKIFNNIFL